MFAQAQSPQSAYRKVELDARIEASQGAQLALICLEELHGSLAQAALALQRGQRARFASEVGRAGAILAFLHRTVDPDHPMRDALCAFYRGAAVTLRQVRKAAELPVLDRLRDDIHDVIEAFRAMPVHDGTGDPAAI